LVGGLIGWLTNMLAVRMLFRPRRPINLLGFRLQGLVPRRQAELAVSIGQTVERHLISHEDVRRAIERADMRAGMEELLHQRITLLIDAHIRQLHPMVAMFVGSSARQKLEGILLAEVEVLLPELGKHLLDSLEEQLDFQQIVEQKVRAFDLDRLEAMILDVAHRELRAIELLGGVLGLLIGLVQVGFLVL
jgi:uncharacterized membrane protein YheB (UPF0754 family)